MRRLNGTTAPSRSVERELVERRPARERAATRRPACRSRDRPTSPAAGRRSASCRGRQPAPRAGPGRRASRSSCPTPARRPGNSNASGRQHRLVALEQPVEVGKELVVQDRGRLSARPSRRRRASTGSSSAPTPPTSITGETAPNWAQRTNRSRGHERRPLVAADVGAPGREAAHPDRLPGHDRPLEADPLLGQVARPHPRDDGLRADRRGAEDRRCALRQRSHHRVAGRAAGSRSSSEGPTLRGRSRRRGRPSRRRSRARRARGCAAGTRRRPPGRGGRGSRDRQPGGPSDLARVALRAGRPRRDPEHEADAAGVHLVDQAGRVRDPRLVEGRACPLHCSQGLSSSTQPSGIPAAWNRVMSSRMSAGPVHLIPPLDQLELGGRRHDGLRPSRPGSRRASGRASRRRGARAARRPGGRPPSASGAAGTCRAGRPRSGSPPRRGSRGRPSRPGSGSRAGAPSPPSSRRTGSVRRSTGSRPRRRGSGRGGRPPRRSRRRRGSARRARSRTRRSTCCTPVPGCRARSTSAPVAVCVTLTVAVRRPPGSFVATW